MSNLTSNTIRMYGGMPSNDIQIQQGSSPTTADRFETLAVATHRRRFMGPKCNGHFSFHLFVDGAGGATSAFTVWYSNHPNPSVSSDSDWVQDTSITAIDLTVATGTFVNVGNVNAEWIMLKAVVAASTANVRCFVRIEGVTHGKGG